MFSKHSTLLIKLDLQRPNKSRISPKNNSNQLNRMSISLQTPQIIE